MIYLTKLEVEHNSLEQSPNIVDLHPDLPEVYRQRVTELEDTFRKNPTERAAASQTFHQLIENISIFPGKRRRQTKIEVTGSLAAILDMTANSEHELR
jgi:hypothetical protein